MGLSRGLFISLEGIDGSGKSTVAPIIVDILKSKGYRAIATSEPTDGKVGQLCREYLSNPNSIPEVDALLFAADRIEHYRYEVLPNLNEGYIVITDRYVHSSIVYQGSQGAPVNWIEEINKFAVLPDMVIYLDIEVDEALKRLRTSNREVREKFEYKEQLLNLKSRYSNIKMPNMQTVDASLSNAQLSTKIAEIILEFYSRHKQDA